VATAKDSRGTSWQIGYMDELPARQDPKILSSSWQGAFAALRQIMQYALRSGLRVIDPICRTTDVRPGNLDRARRAPLQDMREVVYDSWSTSRRQEGGLSGHSLGGQLVIGTLDLARRSAKASRSKRPRPGRISARFRHCQGQSCACSTSPSRATSTNGSRPGTKPASWPRRSRVPSRISAISTTSRSETLHRYRGALQSGYFMNDSEYANLHTEQRVGLAKAIRRSSSNGRISSSLTSHHGGGAAAG